MDATVKIDPDADADIDREKMKGPVKEDGLSPFRRLRIAQIRVVSILMEQAMRLGSLRSLMTRVRKWPLVQQSINVVAGYNRVFPDLTAAEKVAARYGKQGHDSVANSNGLDAYLARPRPSDYPVLFHLSRMSGDEFRVFDLGGASGNLFFLYDQHLAFPMRLSWIVHDLPILMERGRNLARQRGESRLQFTDDLHGACGCDLLLVSGALHYFDFALPDYLASLDRRPRHVVINLTPFVDAPTAATVQYAHGTVMVACRLLNQAELVAGMEKLRYRLVDSWSAPERSLHLPFDPEYSVREYRGLYFRSQNT